MVDADLVRRKLAEIESYQDQIGEYRALTAEQYRSDWKTQRIIDRTLHLMIECCLDVANHLIADRRLRIPSTNAEAFEILAEAGLLTDDLRETMIRMVGFRNLLVHDYARIDPGLVVTVLQKHLADFSRYCTAILMTL